MANELKFTALQANSTIALNRVGNPVALNLECSTDGTTWSTFTVGQTYTLTNQGDYIYLRAPNGSPNTQGCGQSLSNYHQFSMTGQIAASGNIMCLYDSNGETTTVNDCGMPYLFDGCLALVDASGLVLTATTVGIAAYGFMFRGCTSLVSPPSTIDAITLTGLYPFGFMFQGCTQLKTAPRFSNMMYATETAYQRMFENCTSLERGADITLEVGSKNVFAGMYNNCTSLKHTGIIKIVGNSGGYYYDSGAFYTMFQNCSSLKEVYAPLYGNYISTNYSNNWLYGVPATGTYYWTGPAAPTPSSRNASTIPAGWTIQQYVPPSTIKLVKVGDPDPIELEYKLDSDPWQPMEIDVEYEIPSGSAFKVRAPKSHSNTKLATDASSYYKFETTGSLNLSGNITSLLHYKAPDDQAAAPFCFSKLFYQSAGIKDASSLRLNCTKYLGATSIYESMFEGSSITQPPVIAAPSDFLVGSCYKAMFKGCASLLTAAQPPTTLQSVSSYSHQEMFMNCTSLTTACSLNASPSEVGHYAYASMFEGCTSLTTPPATVNVVSNAYQHTATRMFYGCSSLQTAPSLPATAVGGQSYMQMFMNCTSLQAAPALPAATIYSESYRQMFEGCSRLSSVPSLNVSTLGGTFAMESMFRLCTSLADLSHLELKPTAPTQTCYQKIFDGCSSLTKAPHIKLVTANQSTCLWGAFRNCSSLIELKVELASWSGSNNLTDWVSGVPASGDFYCPYDLPEEHGTNRIPSGWTAHKGAEPSVFTLTSLEDGSTVKVQAVGSAPSIALEFKLDSNAWQTYTLGTAITVNEGSSIKFRAPAGRASQSWCNGDSNHNKFVMTGAFDMSGRVGSLLSYDEASQTGWAAIYMFRDCAALRDCSNATIDTKSNVPSYGFASTFVNCTGMTKAPYIKGNPSATGAYVNFFNGCSSLSYIKADIAKSRLSSSFSSEWLKDVAATGTFVSTDPSMTSVSRSVHTVPSGWTIEIAS